MTDKSHSTLDRDRLDRDGRYRPAFVLKFPNDPELDQLVQAFESGNYAYVRKHARGVAERATSSEVKDSALELFRRIKPDPMVLVLLGLAVGLFLFVSIWAYTQGSAVDVP